MIDVMKLFGACDVCVVWCLCGGPKLAIFEGLWGPPKIDVFDDFLTLLMR